MKPCCFTADGTAMLRLKVEMQEPLHLQARCGHPPVLLSPLVFASADSSIVSQQK